MDRAAPGSGTGARSDVTDEITVMVVDDHPMWREGVARDLTERGLKVVATAPDADAALRIAFATRPGVVLMDLNLGAASGVRAIEGILAKLPGTRILVLSASGEHTDVLEAVKAGASGYLLKSASVEELLTAVRRTADGFPVFTPGLAGLVLGEYRRLAGEPATAPGKPAVPELTQRETEVLRWVAKGLTARQTGERLGVSHRTVESHVQSTLRKLQLHNRTQLIRYALDKGLAD
jgi:DNA-binding NarL/FixJ family response regulator